MKIKSLILVVLLAFSSGCTSLIVAGSVAAVSGSTYYVNGSIQASYPVSISHLYDVTLYTFQENSIKLKSVENTYNDADIVAYTLNDEPVTVHIDYDDEDNARISIRIGSISDEKRTRRLLRAIENNL